MLDWIKSDLSPTKRRALGLAMREILQSHGVGVCAGSWGKQLGGGIFEFRLRMAGSQVIDEEAGTKAMGPALLLASSTSLEPSGGRPELSALGVSVVHRHLLIKRRSVRIARF